jgi:hypothetical protein
VFVGASDDAINIFFGQEAWTAKSGAPTKIFAASAMNMAAFTASGDRPKVMMP